MYHSAAPSPASRPGEEGAAPWDLDPALLPALRAVVTAAAEAGSGACLVMTSAGGALRRLVSVRGERHRWRGVAAAVLEHGELVTAPGLLAGPVHGAFPVAGALLISLDDTTTIPYAPALMGAFTAQVQSALAASTAGLAGAQGAVDALVYALAAHDAEAARHTLLVRRLALALGHAARLAPRALLELEWTALLHDVGKIGIVPRLLHKAGPLSATEWTAMRMHPVTGERIVRAVPALDAVGRVVRHHHEQWDGSGYPDRLAGAAIPAGARLVALADAYETMRTGRPYRPPCPREDALSELRACAGSHFDPDLMALLPALEELDIDT